MSRRKVAARLLIATVWLGLLVVASEIALSWAHREPDDSRHWTQLRKLYQPFRTQHINPLYLFFFAWDLEERERANSAVVHVGPEGFRGPGPEAAGTRSVAFVLGGSAAFGYMASSDDTTLAGYLNQIQDQYWFVNAGVNSWTSTQELARLAHQLLAYEPALVLAWDGYNDSHVPVDYFEEGLLYPPGTPESFDDLYALVGDIRGGETRGKPLYEKYFPQLTRQARKALEDKGPDPRAPDAILEGAADLYLYNLGVMQTLVEARGGRFAAFIQPNAHLHRNVPARFKKDEDSHARFRRRVLEQAPAELPLRDFSDLFDTYFDPVPFFDKKSAEDIGDQTIFLDQVHLYDTGNRIAAEAVWASLVDEAPRDD
jgi:hypothetical protein